MESVYFMNREQILITGGDGVVGSYIDFGIRTDVATLDVTDPEKVMAVCKEHMPSAIVHLAAATDLARCEKEPAYAYLVNTAGTYHVALAARAVGARLIYVSTSGVFDGTKTEPYLPEDMPNPVNIYGHSKYLGELAVAGILTDYIIVRTSWIFGGGKQKDNKFIGKILVQAGAKEVRAVTDKRGSPTYAKDLSRALKKLIEEGERGVVHVGGGNATRFDIAREALALVGSKAVVIPAVSSDFPGAYGSGANESMPLSPLMRPWQEALKEYIETEWKK